MLDNLTLQVFEKRIGETFAIDFGADLKIDAKLAEATASTGPSESREPFSIVFHCPHPAPPEQGLYQISHTDIGDMALFLVPIHGDEEGVIFEAVFN